MSIAITKADLEIALARYVDYRQNLVIPNLSHAFFPYWESDIIAISGSGYMTEYEIKTSVSDLKREWRKQRWKWLTFPRRGVGKNGRPRNEFVDLIRRYIIVVPDSIADKCQGLIPEAVGAGLLTFDRYSEESGLGDRLFISRELQKPKVNRDARKITDAERQHLGHLMALRYWTAREKLERGK